MSLAPQLSALYRRQVCMGLHNMHVGAQSAWGCPVCKGTAHLAREVPILHGAAHSATQGNRRSAYLHHVMRVPLKHLHTRPALVPVPQLDEHVI